MMVQPDSNAGASVLVVANQKGGVGKTVTAVNVGAWLAAMGNKVLLIDLDPQASASSILGAGGARPGMYEVLCGDVPLEGVSRFSGREALDLAPGHEDMGALEVELATVERRERRLAEAIVAVRLAYKYVVVDCPPTLGLLTLNGLVAADEVLVPVQCEYLALEGLARLVATLDKVGAMLGKAAAPKRLLMTMYDRRNNLSLEVVREVRRHFGPSVMRTVIPRTVRLAEAPGFARTIIEHDPRGVAALAYRLVAEEIVNGRTE